MKFKMILAGLIIAASNLTNIAYAHLMAFGWDDLDNGTISIYGQHWHSDLQSGWSNANVGVRIGVWDDNLTAANQNTASWELFEWTSFINNMGGSAAQNDALVTAGTLDGWVQSDNFNSGSGNDWIKTSPLTLGNGTWGMFTATSCCVDTMNEPLRAVVTGIAKVPEPTTLAIFALGMFGLASRRFKKQA